MKDKKTIQNLIDSADSLINNREKTGYIGFYEGETYKTLKQVISETAPLSKVGLVYSESVFKEYGVKITKTIKSADSKPLNVVFKGKKFDFNKSEKLINALNEDTRALITLEPNIFPFLSFMAKKRNIPAILILCTIPEKEILPVYYEVNGERYRLNGDRRVIFDLDKICKNGETDKAYAFCFKYLPSFTDYRFKVIMHAVNADKQAYKIASDSLTQAFKIFRLARKEQVISALECSVVLQLVNNATCGEFLDNSAMAIVEKLSGCNMSVGDSLLVSKAIVGLYSLYFSGKYFDLLETPDYNARADELKILTGLDDGVFLKNFKKQLGIIKKEKDNCRKFINSVKKEIISQSESYKTIINTFIAFGGKINEGKDYSKAIRLSGDMPSCLNVMTLLRESGITEYLNV